MATTLGPDRIISFVKLLVSEVVQQEAHIELLVQKAVTKKEFMQQ